MTGSWKLISSDTKMAVELNQKVSRGHLCDTSDRLWTWLTIISPSPKRMVSRCFLGTMMYHGEVPCHVGKYLWPWSIPPPFWPGKTWPTLQVTCYGHQAALLRMWLGYIYRRRYLALRKDWYALCSNDRVSWRTNAETEQPGLYNSKAPQTTWWRVPQWGEKIKATLRWPTQHAPNDNNPQPPTFTTVTTKRGTVLIVSSSCRWFWWLTTICNPVSQPSEKELWSSQRTVDDCWSPFGKMLMYVD